MSAFPAAVHLCPSELEGVFELQAERLPGNVHRLQQVVLRQLGGWQPGHDQNHWAIENSLHGSLDITYREDESRVRNRTFAEYSSWLRRMTLSLIKRHPSKHSNCAYFGSTGSVTAPGT